MEHRDRGKQQRVAKRDTEEVPIGKEALRERDGDDLRNAGDGRPDRCLRCVGARELGRIDYVCFFFPCSSYS